VSAPRDWTRRFPAIPLAHGRALSKPRQSGLTMLVDMGLNLGQLRDLLHTAGDFVDLGKIATGSATLYRADVLAEKLAIYRAAGVKTFIGGQFLEFVIHQNGWVGVPAFFEECAAIGIDAVEVSDNVVRLTLDEKLRLVETGRSAGLEMHGEIGSKTTQGDVKTLVAEARSLIEGGCSDVLIEAAEMVDAEGRVIPDLALAVRSDLPLEKIILELPGHWIDGVGPNDVYRMMTFLVSTFGPSVNVGNVWWDQVLIMEAVRHGLAASGPLPIQKDLHAAEKKEEIE